MSQTKEFKVIRSYERGGCECTLQQAFENGWCFERASEYIPPRIDRTKGYDEEYFGYIEYILSRPIKTS